LGLAPPRRTSNKAAHKLSVSGNLNNLSDIAEKTGCIFELTFFWLSETDLDLPTERLKSLGGFLSDCKPTKSLPRNCKLRSLIGSYSLLETNRKLNSKNMRTIDSNPEFYERNRSTSRDKLYANQRQILF
jgi:hypothetical protein